MHTFARIALLALPVFAACHHADPAAGPLIGPRAADGGDPVHRPIDADGGVAGDGATAPPLPPMSIGGVSITGHTGNQVRQGSGPIEIVVAGCALDRVVDATLDGEPAVVDSVAYDRVIISASVPHGMKTRAYSLTLTEADGSCATLGDALEVTAINVAAQLGRDDAEATPARPLATLTRAMSLAGAGDTIQLAAGEYAAEAWAHTGPNVVAGVAIVGHGMDTILVGPGNDDSVGLWAAGKAEVSWLKLTNFRRGIVATTDAIGLDHVLITGASEVALDLGGDAWLGTNHVELYESGIGARVSGTATLSLYDSLVDLDQVGISASDDAQVLVSASTLSHNGTALDKRHSGIYLSGRAAAQVSATIAYNATAGLYSESTGAVKLEGEIHDNGSAPGCANNYLCSGVVIEAAAAITLQSQLLDNKTYGLVTRGHHTFLSMTASTLAGNGLANAVFDDTDTTLGGTSVTITGTTFSNSQNGLIWSDRVNLQVSQSTMSGHAFSDLTDNMAWNGWVPTFTDVRFGTGAIYPPKPSSGTLVTSASGAPPNGPTWTIAHPVDAGGFGKILFKHQ
jgi:hypothetical protein